MFEGFANVWTPAVVSDELGKKPLGVKIAGEEIVLFRDGKGGLGALRDRCPHRGVALSRGEITADGCLACPFHGWSFQSDGACAHVPLVDMSAEKRARLGATPLPVREIGGLIWVFTGPNALGTEPEPPPALVESGWEVSVKQELWNAHWTRAMENMLDVPHLPFVHRNSIGRDLRKKIRPNTTLKTRIEPASFGGEVYSQWGDEAEQKVLNWRRPNSMELVIMDEGPRRMRLHVYCIPVDREHTKMTLLFARDFLKVKLISWLSTRFNNIIGEDRQVVETSKPPEVPPPGDEPSIATDGPPLFFRKYYYRELRDSSSTLVPAARLVRAEAESSGVELPNVPDPAPAG